MSTPEEDRESLVEALSGAYRERSPLGETRPHPAFFDLDDAGRTEAFDLAARTRKMEAALNPAGLSSTALSVLARIRGGAR